MIKVLFGKEIMAEVWKWTALLAAVIKASAVIAFFIFFAYRFRARICAHVERNMRTYVIVVPFAVILLIVGIFAMAVYPGGTAFFASVAIRGVYGDSFGALNTLFTGLGFAGLTLTLILQQSQLSNQAHQLKIERDEASAARYDATLYQLLELYKGSVAAVLMLNDGKEYKGLNAIKFANQKIIKTIRMRGVAAIPNDVMRQLQKDELKDDGKEVLDLLFYRNAELINSHFHRQGRLIKTFTLLLRHIHDEAPSHVQLAAPVALLQSQLTHIEISYFFLVALAFSGETDLRRLLHSTGILTSFQSVHELELHRYMYRQLWGFDPKHFAGVSQKLPYNPLITPIKKQRQKARKA